MDALYIHSRLRLYGGSVNNAPGTGGPSASDSLLLLRASFRTKVLTPQTAFIVVETLEQERELFALQEELLSRDIAEAAKENVNMDGPDTIAIIVISALTVMIAAALRRRRIQVK